MHDSNGEMPPDYDKTSILALRAGLLENILGAESHIALGQNSDGVTYMIQRDSLGYTIEILDIKGRKHSQYMVDTEGNILMDYCTDIDTRAPLPNHTDVDEALASFILVERRERPTHL